MNRIEVSFAVRAAVVLEAHEVRCVLGIEVSRIFRIEVLRRPIHRRQNQVSHKLNGFQRLTESPCEPLKGLYILTKTAVVSKAHLMSSRETLILRAGSSH